MNEVILVFCTFPDMLSGRQIGTELVKTQLAACVNLCPGVESIYRWQGAIETGAEVLAIFKTTRAAWAAFEARLTALHPYDTPEIVMVRPEAVAARYAAWVGESVGQPGQEA
jgi:periplasmic divalent cation tolerance protein